ncbi:MAG: LPS export ABC transporter periplasmic protein LptC [bacterium]
MLKIIPLIFSLLLCACREAGESVSSGDAGPVQQMSGLTMRAMNRGFYTWDLTSDFAVLAEAESKARLTNPKINFHRQGKIVSRVSALRGTLFTATKDMELRDNVVVNAVEDESVLKGKTLYFTSATDKIWSRDSVTLYQQGSVVKGKGFFANPDLSEIVIEKQKTIFEKS